VVKNIFKHKMTDLHLHFLKVFDNKNGDEVLKYLDRYSKNGFPNVDNVNYTYAKAGQMQLVDHIKGIINSAKKGGG
jgi:hypothetical protein